MLVLEWLSLLETRDNPSRNATCFVCRRAVCWGQASLLCIYFLLLFGQPLRGPTFTAMLCQRSATTNTVDGVLHICCSYDTIVALDEDVRQRIVEMGFAENPSDSAW